MDELDDDYKEMIKEALAKYDPQHHYDEFMKDFLEGAKEKVNNFGIEGAEIRTNEILGFLQHFIFKILALQETKISVLSDALHGRVMFSRSEAPSTPREDAN